jgi:uncharacterized membrane protein YphA (DoxX/SURF4 family)
MKIRVWFYGLATVLTGILNLVWGGMEGSHQPALGQGLPVQHILGYLTGIWLVAAGLALLFRRSTKAGAAASAAIYVIFALLWLPRFAAVAHIYGFRVNILVFILSGLAQQLLLAAPAIVLYVAAERTATASQEKLTTIARWIFGLSPIAFGLGHVMNPPIMTRFVPHWIPFPLFWAIFTGVAFILAGIAIAWGVHDLLAVRLLAVRLLAVRLLALMFLLFEAMVEIPPVFMNPHSQQAWGGAVYNLTAIGACWIFAELFASRSAWTRIASAANTIQPKPDPVIA